ncbi:hypothetical protein [Streptomyces sp.]|uniref:hypothetical protein n=1 Tax=Streptomyces sp. TaxID=1931 RepID=UPI002F93F5BB
MTDYCTIEQLRAELADSKDALDETLLDRAVAAASRAVEDWCGGRTFGLSDVATPRLFRPCDTEVADIDDVGAADGLVVETWGGASWATWVADDYQLEPLNAASRGPAFAWDQVVALSGRWPVGGRRPTLRVTARWGWSAVPAQVEKATILRAIGLFKRKEAVWGVAGFGDFGAVRITRADPDVVDLLSPFRRVVVA